MAESTLSVNYDDLLLAVGGFLGYQYNAVKWSPDQLAEIDYFVQAGVRQFYYPPKEPGVQELHQWSFLNPTATIDTVADQADQDLPDDFGRILGELHFDPSVFIAPVVVVSVARIMALRQRTGESARPQCATVRHKTADGSLGQRLEIAWWPTPAAVYTLTYQYEAYAGKLSSDKPYPLGGMKYAELITESCLSIAEQRANDEVGVHTARFKELLASGVAQDRTQGARSYGHMGEPVSEDLLPRRPVSSNYPITYKGETW